MNKYWREHTGKTERMVYVFVAKTASEVISSKCIISWQECAPVPLADACYALTEWWAHVACSSWLHHWTATGQKMSTG